MTMLREANKAYEIAKKVLKTKNVTVRSPNKKEKVKVKAPYLQH